MTYMDFPQVQEIIQKLGEMPNVVSLSPKELREKSEIFGSKTNFGNINFNSNVKNRSAGLTVYVGVPQKTSDKQKEILKNISKTLELLGEYLKKTPMIKAEMSMGENTEFSPMCTLYISIQRPDSVRLAYMVNQTLFPKSPSKDRLYVIDIPEWQEKDRQILVFPHQGVTIVLGSDYYGEIKKGFLRMGMWLAKQRGMLGLHAGSKLLFASSGKIKKYSMIIFGLTATGKTTHSCHDHGLNSDGEGIKIVQDDVIFLKKDLSTLGTERGFYLKTEGISPRVQPLIYNAVTTPDAIFENVLVDYEGNIHFNDETLTGNARGIMQRDDFGSHKHESINTPPASELDGVIIAFITRRNTIMPIAAKLTAEQAAAAFMLGESVESSGSDPKRAGESVREVGTNPFIIGDPAEEGNRFYEFIKDNPKIQCYLLNTGGVGEIVEKINEARVVKQKVLRVEIPEMAAIIKGIAKDTIEWTKEDNFGLLVPKKVEGVAMTKFDLSRFYSPEQIKNLVSFLKEERKEYIKVFPTLNEKIVSAV